MADSYWKLNGPNKGAPVDATNRGIYLKGETIVYGEVFTATAEEVKPYQEKFDIKKASKHDYESQTAVGLIQATAPEPDAGAVGDTDEQ